VTVATGSGDAPELDETSVDPEEVGEETAAHVREVHETDERLNNPEPVAEQSASDYDAVVFPGGHGTVRDVNQDRRARRLLRNAVAGEDGLGVVICHAVGILGFTRDDDGFLVEGRDVTGFPNAWEEGSVDGNDVMPDGRKLPYWVEDAGGNSTPNWTRRRASPSTVTSLPSAGRSPPPRVPRCSWRNWA
jgi:putative intracellular protease/amidase